MILILVLNTQKVQNSLPDYAFLLKQKINQTLAPALFDFFTFFPSPLSVRKCVNVSYYIIK